MLTTYEFYTTSYHGDSISESSFAKYESKAEYRLQAICYDRITDEIVEEFSDEIQMAVCACADILFQIDFATKNVCDTKNGNIKSMSSGGQSVSFGATDTLITKAMSDKVVQDRLIIDSVSDYLGKTGLLYSGV